MDNTVAYRDWVGRVVAYLAEVCPVLGCTGVTMQSRPVLDRRPQVLLLGYNPAEDFAYDPATGIDERRFFEGNPYFYKDGERRKWRIWTKLYDAMREVGYTEPMEDGNFVFMNAVYFGSRSIAQFERLPGAADAIGRCLDFTREVILDIFNPRCVICLSIPKCFDCLDRRFHFSGRTTLVPERMRQGVHIVSRHAVTKADWEGIPVYGIPHPSGRVDNDSRGAIAQYLKDELTNPNILYT